MAANKFTNVEEYISSLPKENQEMLLQIRECIKTCAPDAEEKLSYGVPAFKINNTTLCYAVFKHHIGLYPTPSVIQHFAQELSPYKLSKGAIQFPVSEPIPIELVQKITQYIAST